MPDDPHILPEATPRVFHVPEGWSVARHVWGLAGVCLTVYGEARCACGWFVLTWEDAGEGAG
jgi:hypothetical protein